MQGRDLSADLFGPAPSAAPVGKDLSADLFGAPAAPATPAAAPAASVGRDLSADLFGAKAPAKKEERPEDQSVFREFADVPLKVAGGVATGVRMIADAFGADSAVSKNMRGVEDWIGELYSAQSKQDSRRMAQIMKEAEDKGVLPNLMAAAEAFKQAPIDLTVSALGTAAPAILAGVVTFLLGAPAAVTTAAGLGVGALMGSGTVKSSIYDATKQTLSEQKELKLTPEQIEKIAVEAQSYGGKNTDMILTGIILGAIGARTGAEPAIAQGLAKQILGKTVEKEAQQAAIKAVGREATEAAAKRGVVKQGLRTGATEFGTEFAQAGQEQLAQNIALQREGFDVPTMRGVVGQGALEGLAGLGMGAVTGGRQAYTAKRELAAEQPVTDAEKSQFTTERETAKKRLAAAPTAEDIDLLTPITDKAGQPLVGAAPETLTAKEKADAEAAAAAEAAKLSLDEATTKANELLAKVDAGGAVKQTEFRPVAKALGVKIPFGTKNADAVELIRAHLAQQGAPSAATTGTDESAAGASAGMAGQPSAVAPTAGAIPSGVVPPAPTAGPATAGAGAQPGAVTPFAYKDAGSGDTHLAFETGDTRFQLSNVGGKPQLIVRDPKLGGPAVFYAEGKRFDSRSNVYGADQLTSMFPNLPSSVVGPLQGWLSSGKVNPEQGQKVAQALNTVSQTQAAPAPAAPAATKKSAVQADRDELDSLFGDDESSLSARRTDAEITRDQKMDQIGRRFGLSRSADETAQQFRARIKEAMDFEEMREGKPLSEISEQDIAKQTLREDGSYVPPDLQIEAYEEARKIHNDQLDEDEQDQRLPAYKELSANDRRVYFQEGLPRPGAGTAAQHAAAARKLAEYRSGAQRETFEGEAAARESYSRERSGFGRKTGLSYSFPVWFSLSDASKKVYAAINKTDSLAEQYLAFSALKKQIQKEKAEEARTAALTQAETDATREMLAAAARARKSQPAGKGDLLPDSILKKLLAGDITAVLDYIKEHGNGLKPITHRESPTGRRMKLYNLEGEQIQIRDSIAMGVFRNLAARLLDVEGLKVNVVYDENMVYDQIARYDANTNTMYVGPNGLDEATVLHELLHAATVKIIHQFYTDASKLSAHARKAVEHLIQIAAMAKSRLGSNPKFAGAFENLYEFVAYSQTDMDFQHALAQEQVGSLATVTKKDVEQTELAKQRESKEGAKMYDAFMDNLWNAYTGSLAYLYKLFKPGQTTSKFLFLVPTFSGEDIKNKVQNPGKGLTGKAREDAIAAFNKKLREEKERDIQRKGEEKKAFEEKLKKAIREIEDGAAETPLTEADKFYQAVGKLEKERKLTANEKAAFDIEGLFEREGEEYEAKIPDIDDAQYVPSERGITNLKRGILREPGYKGNLLLEASEMVSMILEAPEGNIERLAGKEGLDAELYARTPRRGAPAPAATTDVEEGATPPERTGGVNDPANREFYKLKGKEKITSKAGQAWKAVRTAAGWRDIVRRFQDKSVESRSLHKKLDMAGLINRDVEGAFNNFDEQRDLATGMARNYLNTYLRAPMDNIKQSVGDYAKLVKKGIDDVVVDLHMFAEMFHEPERRHIKWLRSVPLSTTKNLTHNGKKISAAQRRIDIMGDPRTGAPGLIDRIELTEAQQQQLRAELEYLAKNFADPLGDSPRIKSDKVRARMTERNKKAGKLGVMDIDENASVYNVLGINKAEVDLRRQEYDALDPKQRELLDKIFAEAKVITDRTAELDKIGNYWSYPVSNLVGLYNYQHYMPFKGVSKHSVVDQYLSFDSEATGKDMQDVAHSADGRFSVSDNPLLQMMSDAFRSAGRAGRRDYMQSIKNAVKPNKLNPTGTGVIDGEVAKHIEFAERNIVDLSEFKGGSNIFVYNPDGSIDIIRIKDPKILNALRYSLRDAAPLLDMANAVTGFFGAMHTRYNYNFAPLNFVRDALTNAWNIGASKLGPLKSAKYIQMMSAAVVKNGLGKAMEVAYLHEKGDPVSERILLNAAKNDPFVRDMLEYLKFGGKTTYMESFSLKSSLQDLSTKLGKRRIMDNVDSFNEFIDVWNNMFEFTSRTAAYTLYKKEALKRNIDKGMSNVKDADSGMSPAEIAAATEAAAWTKNLANFEKAGEYAREMGAFYMFIRPSATGAVRAAEAALPAFRTLNMALNDLPAEVRNDPAALENFKKEYALEQRNARIMISTLMGMGFAAYWMSALMAPDDEWKRNNVKTDNMQQWTRFARFHIPNEVSQKLGLGRDVVFQLPWGFGLGAFAAAGAQLAGLSAGASSIKDALANTVTSMTDSFLPIPVSRISPLESPESSLKWVIDSVAPTVVRPGVEFIMNTNGIGQAINSASSRRMGDAFTGGDRIPLIYKDAAEALFRKTNGYLDWSPNTLYFFSNSYLDGLAKVGEIGYSWSNIEKGEKEFNVKTDLALFGSFFGAKTNVDSREYGDIEKRIKELDKRLTTLDEIAPDRAARFDAENPLARGLVDAYKTRQGELNKLRAEANEIRRDTNLSPKTRDALLRIAIMQQNILKHEMVMDFKAYGEKP